MKQAEIEKLRAGVDAGLLITHEVALRLLEACMGDDVAVAQNMVIDFEKRCMQPVPGSAKINGHDGLVEGCQFLSGGYRDGDNHYGFTAAADDKVLA